MGSKGAGRADWPVGGDLEAYVRRGFLAICSFLLSIFYFYSNHISLKFLAQFSKLSKIYFQFSFFMFTKHFLILLLYFNQRFLKDFKNISCLQKHFANFTIISFQSDFSKRLPIYFVSHNSQTYSNGTMILQFT